MKHQMKGRASAPLVTFTLVAACSFAYALELAGDGPIDAAYLEPDYG